MEVIKFEALLTVPWPAVVHIGGVLNSDVSRLSAHESLQFCEATKFVSFFCSRLCRCEFSTKAQLISDVPFCYMCDASAVALTQPKFLCFWFVFPLVEMFTLQGHNFSINTNWVTPFVSSSGLPSTCPQPHSKAPGIPLYSDTVKYHSLNQLATLSSIMICSIVKQLNTILVEDKLTNWLFVL